jgi:hypothetical protein
MAELCQCQASKAGHSRRNEERLEHELENALRITKALQTEWVNNVPAVEDVKHLLECIAIVGIDEENELLDFEAIGEVGDWFSARPDANVENSVSFSRHSASYPPQNHGWCLHCLATPANMAFLADLEPQPCLIAALCR